MRAYPGEFVTRELPGYFLAQPTPFVQYTFFDPSCPGRFLSSPVDILYPQGDMPYAGRLVVLINESTLSQAEYTAMALRATPHCILLGSLTAGADSNVSRLMLPGNVVTALSGIGIYYPDGRATERIGLVPDMAVRPTLDGIRAGKDELRERAVELIMQTSTIAH